jgi:hypothetical protein
MASTLFTPIAAALLSFLQTQCGATFNYYSRRFMTWENMKEARQAGVGISQPALFVYEGVGFGGGKITYTPGGATPYKREMSVDLVVYAQMTGGGTPAGVNATDVGADVFYPLLESIQAAFDTTELNAYGMPRINLGGVVQHCWIEGDVHLLVGDIDPDGQGMMTVPVKILIP